MKLYKISGSNEYVDWDVLHNQQGYSLEATNSVTWMSAGDSTHEWGESVQTGYLEPIILRFTNSKGFCLGVYGWHTLNEMALEYGLWPDEAEEEEARSSTLGVSKVAVMEYTTSLRPPEIAKMYLVQKELEEGWMDEDTFAERGWEIVPDVPLGELVFVDASGAVVYSVESLNEMTFAPTGYFTIDDADDVVFVEESPYPARGSLAKNYTPNVTIADGSGVDTELPYYSQKLYIPVVVWHDENWNLGTDYFGWSLSDSSGSVYTTNNTGSSRIVISIIVAMIDATDAEIVEVKNQSDAHFHAFKWTSGGVPYWYVVDGDEDWTDDLQADGYEEVPSVVLPTVTEIWTLPNNSTGISTIQSGDANTLWKNTPSWAQVTYDVTSCYAVAFWRRANNTLGGRTEFSTENISGLLAARNVSSHAIEVYWVKVAVCSSNQATVVTVYDSSNIAYNAFKFTASGTDYYYVLDGVQADWTDDLAGIGYSLTPAVITAYFTNRGSSATSDTTIHPGSSGSTYYALYDASGTNIDNDSSKTYTFYKAYRYDGTEVGFSSTPQVGTGGYWYLDFHVPGSGWSSSAFRIEYTVS